MDNTDSKFTVSLKHCYATDSHVLKLSPTSIHKIEKMFGIQLGSCAGSIQKHGIYLSEPKRDELLRIYESDVTLNNSVNDSHGDYFKYVDPAKAALSNHGLYDVTIEYNPPQNTVIQPITSRKPRNLFEKIFGALVPQTA